MLQRSLDPRRAVVPKRVSRRAGREPEGFAELRRAALAHDGAAFAEAARQVDWPRAGADDHETAVRLSLEAGAYGLSRHLAEAGAALYPEHARLARFAHLLAPPRLLDAHGPAEPGFADNHAWLRDHARSHAGKWVALRDGVLLGSADSYPELRQRVDAAPGTLMARV